MTDRPEALFPLLLRALACACLLALGGCGPGTGGTGTGPVMAKFMGTTSPAFVPSYGLCAVSTCGDVFLRLEPATVELRLVCRRFVHTGDWHVNAEGVAEVQGTIETTSGGTTRSAPGILRLQFTGAVESATQVSFTLLDAANVNLTGPVTVQREDAALAPVPGSCN